MILVLCLPCELAVRIMPARVGDALSLDELETLVGRKSPYWPDKYPCPNCTKEAKGIREVEADPEVLGLLNLHDLTPEEAFAAFNGLGFPGEQTCTFEEVQELLKKQPIRRVIGRTVVHSTRAVLDAIELWDGTKLHLGAGMEGAVVYRISRPPGYTDKALEGTS